MNRQEYNHCVDSYADALYRFILKATNDKQESDDIIQDSFIALWENSQQISKEKAKSYLFTTAYRKMVDAYRRNKKSERLDNIKEPISNDDYLDLDLSELLERGLQRLSEIQRHIIILRDYEGYNYEEIGVITGLSDSQVRVYLFRARNNMKKFIVKKELII